MSGATQDQIKAWMREQLVAAGERRILFAPGELAWLAFNHFSRPYHLNVMRGWARNIFAAEAERQAALLRGTKGEEDAMDFIEKIQDFGDE